MTIGWAGGIGHKASLVRWESAIRAVLRARPETRFVSVGYGAAVAFMEEFGTQRAVALPSAKIEVYPASMTLFDIAIAPSGENNLFRGKSDLRWLEASALGLPLVADPDVYPEIEDGVTGIHARTPAEVEAALLRLVDDRALREGIGRAAYEHVAANRCIQVAAERWRDVLLEVGCRQPGARRLIGTPLQNRAELPINRVSFGPHRSPADPGPLALRPRSMRGPAGGLASPHTPPRDGSRRAASSRPPAGASPAGRYAGQDDPLRSPDDRGRRRARRSSRRCAATG